MIHPSDTHFCPLLKRNIFYGGEGGCIEIQEVRDDSMDIEFLPFALNVEEANKICEQCKWYKGDDK